MKTAKVQFTVGYKNPITCGDVVLTSNGDTHYAFIERSVSKFSEYLRPGEVSAFVEVIRDYKAAETWMIKKIIEDIHPQTKKLALMIVYEISEQHIVYKKKTRI